MASDLQVKCRHEPLVMVDTSDLPREEWLQYRRRGIGGSDVASIFGVSPFRTCRDIYYDKLGIAVVMDDESNWVQLEMVPILMCSAKIGEELSQAALSRGLKAGRHRTNICEIGFRLIDFIFIGISIAAILLIKLG